jgi:hypothetical protein
VIAVLLSMLAAHAACTIDAPPDAPFEVEAPSDGDPVALVLVLRVPDDPAAIRWARSMLDVLDERGIQAGLAVQIEAPSAALQSLVVPALDAGHTLVVRLRGNDVARDFQTGPRRTRKRIKPVTRVFGKARVAEIALEDPTGSGSAESVLNRIGIKTLLETNGAATGTPRSMEHFDAQPDNGVVLPAGPYTGRCGKDPVVSGFTPPAADRVTQATYGARSAGVGVVRLTLEPPTGDADTDPLVLARWLDQVILPHAANVQIGAPDDALRDRALAALRSGRAQQSQATEGGRLVRVDEVRKAAEFVGSATTLPRLLPGDLSPTEAFQAFASVLLDDIEGSVVRLRALQGPATRATSAIDGPTPLSRDDLVALLEALRADRPDRIPAALPVGPTLLAAPELLTAMASAVRGDDPPIARPIGVPEPNADGLGWGRATTP